MLKNLKLLQSYMVKTIFFQQHNELFGWNEIEDSIIDVG